MALKHNLSIMSSQSDPFWGIMLELNTASSGVLGWAILILIFAVSVWVATKQTQDLGKSMLIGLWLTTLVSILLFYAGKATVTAIGATSLVSEITMLTLLVATAVSISGMYFLRNKGA